MEPLHANLDNLDRAFPDNFLPEQIAAAKTAFFKHLALSTHRFYGGKIQVLPKAGIYGFNWFNVWYTPGVSRISTAIRDNPDLSYELTSRGNLVAVITDSTRVLGDGNVGPAGGMGVMEGKAFLMKYLGGIDAVPLCVDSRNARGEQDPDILIDFVRRCAPTFGAVNLEDISQPSCYRVLDVLRETCDIPIWHDDAQGTGCVTLAALFNALKVVGKQIDRVRIVLFGAGASNTTIARLILLSGANPELMVLFDSRGSLGRHRDDIKADPRFYRKWELCVQTNPRGIRSMDEAMRRADVLIALSRPGPDTIKPEWVRMMAAKSIVFACANPVPEIYPTIAKQAGAYVVATGRGDFPNQVNNSVGFPGILKGALLVRAKKITDQMAIAAAQSLAAFAEKRGLSPEYIIPTMDESDVFPHEAADVAAEAVRSGLARCLLTREEAFARAAADIRRAQQLVSEMIECGWIARPPEDMLQDAWRAAVQEVTMRV